MEAWQILTVVFLVIFIVICLLLRSIQPKRDSGDTVGFFAAGLELIAEIIGGFLN